MALLARLTVCALVLGIASGCTWFAQQGPGIPYATGSARITDLEGAPDPAPTEAFLLVDGSFRDEPLNVNEDGSSARFRSDAGWEIWLDHFGTPGSSGTIMVASRSPLDTQEPGWVAYGEIGDDCTATLSDDPAVDFGGTVRCVDMRIGSGDGPGIDVVFDFDAHT